MKNLKVYSAPPCVEISQAIVEDGIAVSMSTISIEDMYYEEYLEE